MSCWLWCVLHRAIHLIAHTRDAQRETGEAFIASQKGEGWVCLETPYDDGGYSGGNMDRTASAAFKRSKERDETDAPTA